MRESPIIKFEIIDSRDPRGRRRMLWEAARKAIGQDIPVCKLETGDSVAFVAKNLIEYNQASEMVLNERDDLVPIYAPYIYFRARCGGDIKPNIEGAGSTDTGMVTAICTFGQLAADNPKVPPYSAAVSDDWGHGNVPDDCKEADVQLVHAVSCNIGIVDIMIALDNGYPVGVFGDLAFEMEPNPDGYHNPTEGIWPHGFTVIGFEYKRAQSYLDAPNRDNLSFILLNNWGDCHGRLIDFVTGVELPPGCLRVTAAAFEKYVKSRQYATHVFCPYDRFANRAQRLDVALPCE